MLAGTNNLQFNTDREIVEGILFTAKAVRERQPSAKLYVVGILPRRGQEERIKGLNGELQKELMKTDAVYVNLAPLFVKEDGRIDPSLFSDGLHPNEKGYDKIAEAFLSGRIL